MAAPALDPPPIITAEQFERFREFFYRRTGIAYAASKRAAVEKRIAARMQALSIDSFREYFARVTQPSGPELQALINALTVNETYFFREDYQLRCIAASILAEVVADRPPGSRVRLWSIPCSTGEEPYSLALFLLENWALVDDYEVEILASDIDSAVLEAAQEGIYGARSLQYVPQPLLRRYFRPAGDGRFQIISELRSSISFSKVNVHNATEMKRLRNIDVILCRNLLIYFDDVSRRKAAEALYDSLRPGGFICLGHSESMSRISSLFRVRKFPDAIVYQRPPA